MSSQETLNMYVVRLGGIFTIDVEVAAESPERAAEIAWQPPDGEYRPGEAVFPLSDSSLESCDEDGPKVVSVEPVPEDEPGPHEQGFTRDGRRRQS